MASAVQKIEPDDILAVAEATVAGFATDTFETAGSALASLQEAARAAGQSDDRRAALDDLTRALGRIEGLIHPVGQSVARTIAAATLDLIQDREEELLAREPRVVNAMEMHVASLVMAVRRRMISGRMPVAAALLSNLAALRVQLPQALSMASKMASADRMIDDGDRDDDGGGAVKMEAGRVSQIRSWSERLAGRLMGRRS